jgi:outer membrane protein TolC
MLKILLQKFKSRGLETTWIVGLLVGQLLLGGCMKLGPDFQRPGVDIETPRSFQNGKSEVAASDPINDRWWEIFNDPDLNRMVVETLKRNLDIQKAVARILETQSRFIQTRADRYPSLSFQGQVSKQRASGSVPVAGPQGLSFQQQKTTNERYSLSLPALFELDFWGRGAGAA